MKHLALLLPFFLAGCFDTHRSTDSLCSANPQLCANLNNDDGQCRLPRTELIWQRYEVSKAATDDNLFKELEMTIEYETCLALAAGIEPTDLKERKAARTDALIYAGDRIEALTEQLRTSQEPEILYFLWTNGDDRAGQRFLAMEGTAALDTPSMQLALASYYSSRSIEKTLNIVERGLELTVGESNFEPELVLTMATLQHQMSQPQQAYVWAKVGQAYELPVANSARLKIIYPMDDASYQQLDATAEKILQDLQNGRYRRQNYVFP
uniref:DUF2989 domain-containing protein n=1 Tax=Thaumasiovibrio occultus TaxID=1891184 RepID=UPI00131EC2A1|nr:DUF2989 domain-containing protein [Thaumasiovibrio occultus]